MDQKLPSRIVLMILCVVAVSLSWPAGTCRAQAPSQTPPAEFQVQEADAVGEEIPDVAEPSVETVTASLETLASLLDTVAAKRADIEEVKREIQNATTEVEETERLEVLRGLQTEVLKIESQIQALATGTADTEFDLASGEDIDLKTEIEQLFQPFVLMLKSATDDARQIERLRRLKLTAQRHRTMANRALENIEPLLANNQDAIVGDKLVEIKALWQERLAAASDRSISVDRQLSAKLASRESATDSARRAFTGFFRDRGINLLLGVGAFLVVVVVMRVIARVASRLYRRRNAVRSTSARVASLLFTFATFALAIVAMLIVFNTLNDWLLLGITMIFLIALGWVSVKMIPSMVEQIALLLNLGAVQEGERVMFNGIPWNVKSLDFYTDLENPALAGGTFTVPIRELIGLHSRPTSTKELWFPCAEGDWVKLQDDNIGRVIFQSPEMVQIEELGGARITYPTGAFLEQNPKNLSGDYRVEVEFGIDYRHQAIATTEIMAKLQQSVHAGLSKILAPDELRAVEVEFLRAGNSSLDYEVEADIAGKAAHRFEQVERTMAAILVDTCNENGWVIPFPQLTLHRADAA